MKQQSTTQSKSGASYFIEGFTLIKQPKLRRFVIIPLVINLLLFAVAIYMAVGQLEQVFNWISYHLPTYLKWLNFLLWPLAILTISVLISFIFGAMMNWLAAPFNGLLAEKVEQYLTGDSLYSESNIEVIKDLPRVFKREWTKFKYYLPRAILFLILFWLPVVGQTVAPILWFLFTAWMMSIQYCDYPFDNHKVPFGNMKAALNQTRGSSFSFGATVTLFSMIPFVNFVVMPVAICGATSMWVDKYRAEHRNQRIDTNN